VGEINVDPEALQSTASAIRQTGNETNELRGQLSGIQSWAASIRDIAAGAAYDRMLQIWLTELSHLSEGDDALAATLNSGAVAYVATDNAAMGGGGGH
jgi:uncharacterized protein YukE